MGLTTILNRLAQRHDGHIAIVDADTRLRWADWRDAAARFAGGLQSLGIQRGDRVAMLARNGAPFCIHLFGTWWAGAVVAPINLRWSALEIAASLADCEARLLIVGPEFVPLIDAIRTGARCVERVIVVGDDSWTALTTAEVVPDAGATGDDLAAILYTGGTTGRSKGVMVSHRNMLASALGGLASIDAPHFECFVQVAPMFHIGALSALIMTTLSGGSSVLLPGFDAGEVLATVECEQANALFMVPTMLRMLLDDPRFGDHDLSSLQTILYGAAPMDVTLLDRVIAAMPGVSLVQAYGMTELSPIATLLGAADHRTRNPVLLRSAGRPTSSCEVRIVDDGDREVPRGEVGEIVARGENVMLGYWGMPEATEAALRGGWMHTGDLGHMNDAGYVTVVDRLKDMIVTGGENVYSAEVEDALSSHPDVAAIAVIGVPDLLWGERVHAVVVAAAGATPELPSIIAHCRDRLAGYKMPRSLSVVATLPLSAAGKVLKTVLRDAAVAEGQN